MCPDAGDEPPRPSARSGGLCNLCAGQPVMKRQAFSEEDAGRHRPDQRICDDGGGPRQSIPGLKPSEGSTHGDDVAKLPRKTDLDRITEKEAAESYRAFALIEDKQVVVPLPPGRPVFSLFPCCEHRGQRRGYCTHCDDKSTFASPRFGVCNEPKRHGTGGNRRVADTVPRISFRPIPCKLIHRVTIVPIGEKLPLEFTGTWRTRHHAERSSRTASVANGEPGSLVGI